MSKEYVHPGKSVHITPSDLGERVILKPSNKSMPKGVSFSPTIRKSLEVVEIDLVERIGKKGKNGQREKVYGMYIHRLEKEKQLFHILLMILRGLGRGGY